MQQFDSPSEAQTKALTDLDANLPLAVLNLFHFNDVAVYSWDDPEYGTKEADISGREAFARYGVTAQAVLSALGGHVAFSTPFEQVMIGPADLHFDQAAIMYFPTRAAYLSMLQDEEFKVASRHRKAALANHYMFHLDGTPFQENAS